MKFKLMATKKKVVVYMMIGISYHPKRLKIPVNRNQKIGLMMHKLMIQVM